MAYKSDTVAAVIKRLNTQYLVPAIQRKFIWEPPRVISLFDSIMRGYPIGSFLFWELNDSYRDKWDAYRFVENAIQGGTENKHANVAGVHDLTLILDGQQRLTSLLVGLKGTYEIKKKHKRRDDPDAWSKQRLYVDLLKDHKVEPEDGEEGIYYGFQFIEKTPSNEQGHYWFKVGQILDFDIEDEFYKFRQAELEKLPDNTTKVQMHIFERNLERLYRAIFNDDVISYYVETDQDYDRVLDIFRRANEGGIKLNKSQLLLSMITAKWSGINARDEINGFVERLNRDLNRKNDLSADFIMKSCLVLSNLPVAYKVRNFDNENLLLIQDMWSRIKSAIEKAVELTNIFGIDRDTLTSENALIPIAYYLLLHPDLDPLRSTPTDVGNTMALRQWITMVLLNNVLGGASDTMLTNIREVLKKNETVRDFPIIELNKEIARLGRKSHFDQEAIDKFLDIKYGEKEASLALSLLYDDNNWGTVVFNKDHIFPKNMFSWASMKEAGFTKEQHKIYNEIRDNVANLELLTQQENLEKLNKPFDRWINTRDAGFKKRHLIPDDLELCEFKNFQRFVEQRERLIQIRLQRLFGLQDIKE
ncbi:MAG: DUF262 domain-containing protein [Dehalococcoidia bacterium]|nr:DUF262 domain-containing protein [Dehalococcoidia bacterium]